MSAVEVMARARSLMPRRQDLIDAGHRPGANLVAGVTVAIVALPLALAFGVSSGLGASAGVITAVVAGAIAAVFGGSNLQVSGPTGAMTVVLIPVVADHGVDGVLMVGLLAGIALVVLGWLGLGRYVRHLPMPVIEGFTAGIAVVIALQQFPAAFGVSAEGEHVWQVAFEVVRDWVTDPNWAPPLIAVTVAVGMLVMSRFWPRIPWSLVMVVVATAAVSLIHIDVDLIGRLPAGLPAPSAAFFNLGSMVSLIPSALAVCALAALESLLCATVADQMTVGQHHDPDRELVGQGLANMAVPFFGGVPATAAIARTAVNVRAGASSRLAALTHAVVLLVLIMALAPVVGQIPLAALAGVLLATTLRMVEVASLLALMKATRGDAAVLLLTFVVTVAFDLVTAVGVGVGLAFVVTVRQIARSTALEQEPLDLGDHSDEEHALLNQHIVAYRFDGPLFFAASNRFLMELTDVSDVRAVILRMSSVTALDATGAKVLDEAISRLEHKGIVVLLSGIADDHDQLLARVGVAEHLRTEGRILPSTPAAIQRARELLNITG